MNNNPPRPFSLKIFLPNGDPAGIKIVEKSNWNGCAVVIPRALFGEAIKTRPEVNRAGVYLLLVESEGGHLPRVYIGEGDPVRPRLEHHARNKDFWTHAIIFVSKDQTLNKAHVQRLESRLVSLATTAKRCVLDNGNVPQPPSLSEAETADIDCFLEDALLCLTTLGYTLFKIASAPLTQTQTLLLSGKGVEASGIETPEGFLVYSGAKAVKSETASCHAYLREMRTELLQQDVLRDIGDVYQTTQNYTFSSPSTAAGVLLARSSNGRVEWKTAEGKTLKSIQETGEGV